MKAVALMASPRQGGVIDSMTDAALEVLRDAGFETVKRELYRLEIGPCMACYACMKGNPCPIGDDVQGILADLEDADVVVMGSPTYWSNVPAPAKALFDRCMGYFEVGKLGPKRMKAKPSRVLLMTACLCPAPMDRMLGISTGCMKAMRAFFRPTRARITRVTAAGTSGSGSAGEKVLVRVRKAAKRIADSLRG
jgi:putative NADPH-quinone reductase